MPWTESDAQRHTHLANTPKRRRMWAHIANGELESSGNDKRAIMAANGALAKHLESQEDTDEEAGETPAQEAAERPRNGLGHFGSYEIVNKGPIQGARRR